MSNQFPINFFRAIFSVKKIFTNRGNYKWWQLIFVFIFIQSLLMIPLTLSLVQRGSALAENFLPEEFQTIDAKTVETINQFTFVDGQLDAPEKVLLETDSFVVGTNLSETVFDNKTGIDFRQDAVLLSLPNESAFYTLQLFYTEEFIGNLKEATFLDTLQDEIYRQNTSAIFLSTVLNIAFVLLAMNGMLILGITVLLYFTKKASAIRNFKESLMITLSLISGGIILATLVGFFINDIFLLFGIQSIWLIGMSVNMFVKTRFKRADFIETIENGSRG